MRLVRNSAKTVLHTIYLLKQLPSLETLPVNDLIYILGMGERRMNKIKFSAISLLGLL